MKRSPLTDPCSGDVLEFYNSINGYTWVCIVDTVQDGMVHVSYPRVEYPVCREALIPLICWEMDCIRNNARVVKCSWQ
jgi:hypothetical protein